MSNHLILIHGYSDRGKSFETWKKLLVERGFPKDRIHIVTYESLTDEVTIKDIAEGFDRALRTKAGLAADEPFDAIVHSTGMLVIRSWLVNFPERRARLKRLIGIAPATFGSPLAHTGRSTLGAIFKGNKEPGADFLESGREVLFGLELGSRFTWDLAHEDLIGERGKKGFYGLDAATPYVFVFCGNTAYGGLRRLVNKPGTDGTVRFAGCALNTRKITMDLTRPAESDAAKSRFRLEPWTAATTAAFAGDRARSKRFQQFVVHAVDERGDGIEDFNLQLLVPDPSGSLEELSGFDMDVHVYQRDPSYRCFHVDLESVDFESLQGLCIEVTASTGSRLVGYLGYDTPGKVLSERPRPSIQTVRVDITAMLRRRDFTFFYPFTTTLVELRLNREPLPPDNANEVCWFD